MDLFGRLRTEWLLRRVGRAPTYVYEPLHPTKTQIRIIQLLPSTKWTSPIKVGLRTVDFEPTDDPKYEALSYTWGAATELATIYVVDIKQRKPKALPVTKNCDEALRYLRLAHATRTLWVDAICIDQALDTKSLAERGKQVAMMGEIYSRAARVNAWLGPASEDSHIAIDWIKTVAQHLSIDPDNGQLESISDDPLWCNAPEDYGQDANIDKHQVDALANLLSRPYFGRLWIWPEVRLSIRRAQLVCGWTELPWLSFCASSNYMMARPFRYYQGNYRLFDIHNTSERLIHPVPLDLLSALDGMRRCECLDAKDRVYVAQATQRREALQILPDYSSSVSVSDVWTDAILNYLRVDRNLWFLSDVQEMFTQIPGLPSWVPDWSQPRLSHKYPYGRASAYSAISVTNADRRVLKVHGVQVGVIRHTTPFQYTAKDTTPSDHEVDPALKAMLFEHVSMETVSNQLLSLRTVLCLGRFRHLYDPPRMDQATME